MPLSFFYHLQYLLYLYLHLYLQVYVYLSVCLCHCLSHLACGDARSARESERAGAVQLPVQVQSSGLCGSVHTLGLLQRWRWWTPCSKSSSTRRGRRREACGGFRTSSLFQFQRGECCCKASCCTNRYHTPAESRSRLIKWYANLQSNNLKNPTIPFMRFLWPGTGASSMMATATFFSTKTRKRSM